VNLGVLHDTTPDDITHDQRLIQRAVVSGNPVSAVLDRGRALDLDTNTTRANRRPT